MYMPIHKAQKLLRAKSLLLGFMLALALMLGACGGWQLRGYGGAAAMPERVNLVFDERNYRLINTFKRIFENYDVQQNAEAELTLFVDKESLDKRPIAYTETGIAAQYQLELSIHYRLANKQLAREGNAQEREQENQNLDSQALLPQRVQASRNYDFDPVRISSEAAEEEKLVGELREELIIEILNRIAALSSTARQDG